MKTKHSPFLAILFACITSLTGCTRNNGGEEELYGQWHLMSIDCEGMDIEDYSGNIYWSFQSTTIEIKEVRAYNEVNKNYGNFHLADETLFIDFSYPDFMPPAILGLPRQAELQVLKITGGEMVLAYGSPAVIYHFKRW